MKSSQVNQNPLDSFNLALIEQFPVAIAFLDTQLQCLVLSQRWCEDYRIDGSAAQGRAITELLKIYPSGWDNALQQALKGNTAHCDGEWVEIDGQQEWLRWQIKPYLDPEETVQGVFIESEILTPQKQKELNYQQNLKRLQTFIDHTFQLSSLLDPQGMVLETNETALEKSGLSETEVVGQPFWEIPWPMTTPELKQQIKQDIQQASQGKFVRRELVMMSPEGKQVIMDFSITPVQGDQGEIEFLITEGRDISDRLAMEAELRKSEARLNQAQQLAHLGSWEWDIKTGKITWSQEVFRIHGLNPDQDAPDFEQYLQLIHPEDHLKFHQSIKQSLHQGKAYQIELRAVRPDGTIRYLLTRGQPIRSSQDKITHVFGTVLDITDRKQIEMQLLDVNQVLEERIAERTLQLQENEAEYRAIFEHAGIGLDYLNAQGRLVRVNERCCEIFGYSQEELLQKTFRDITHPDDLHQDLKCQKLLIAGEISNYNLEKRCFRKDGSIVWINLTKSIIRDAEGNPKYFVGALQDISDRKSLESELSLQKAQFDAFFIHAPVGLAIVNTDLRFVQVNNCLAAMGDHTPEEHIGKTVEDIEPHLAPTLNQIYRHVFETQQPILNYEVQGQLVHQSNEDYTWLCSYFPLPDAEGSIIGLGSMVVDISDRKRIEKEQTKLLAILDSTTDFVGTSNVNGQLTYLNKAGRQMLGISLEEDITQFYIFDLMTPAYAEYSRNEARPKLLEEGILQGEGYFQHRDGHAIPVSQVVMTHKSPTGEIEFISNTARDIAELKKVEFQLRQQAEDLEQTLRELQKTQAQLVQTEKMSSLGQLVAGVAHEINNPVNFIYGNLNHATEYIRDLLGLVELYQDCYPNPTEEIEEEIDTIDLDFLVEDLPKLLSSMQVGADRIKEIVASLRNFSRMDEAEQKPVNIHDGLDSTLMILHNRTKARSNTPGVEITTHYAELPPIECYAGQLNQVFMNILSNAIDAIEERDCDRTFAEIKENPSQIIITTSLLPNDQIQISIKDNGPGIPEEVQLRLFDPFFTTKPVGKGTGLGLSISYQIITEKHQGTLTCHSEIGQGTEFIIHLPIHH